MYDPGLCIPPPADVLCFLLGERRLDPEKQYAVIFGNEVHGISQEAVDLCDFTLEIPQWGTKHSLNVSVAIGIVLYVLTPRG